MLVEQRRKIWLHQRCRKLPDKDFMYAFKDKSDFPSGYEFKVLRISMDMKNLMKSMIVWKRIIWWDGLRTFINGITKIETSVIDGAIRDNFAIRIGMKNLSVENFKMVFGVSKDESIQNEKRYQGYISIDGKMEQYEFLQFSWRRLRRCLRSSESRFVIVTESTMQIGGQCTRNWKIITDNETMRINDERERNISI